MKLFIENNQVDTYDPEKVDVPMTYTVKDMKEPDKIKGSRSTTLKVPNTKNNFINLGNPLGVNDDNKINTAWIDHGGPVWRGVADIVERRTDEYKLILVGDNAGWFSYFKETDLNELDLGIHILTEANVIATWTDLGSTLYYPLVDYGEFQDRANDYDVQMEQLYPGTRLKMVLDKAFGDAGYTVQWKGSLGDLSWIMPFTTGEVQATPGFLKDYKAQATGGFTRDFTSGPSTQPGVGPLVIIPTGTETVDPNGDLVITGVDHAYTSPFTGEAKFEASFNMQFTSSSFDAPFMRFSIWNTTDNVSTGSWKTIPVLPGQSWDFTTEPIVFEDVPVIAGKVYKIVAHMSDSTFLYSTWPTNVLFSDVTLDFQITNIEWQENFEFALGETLPDTSIMDVIKGLNAIYNIVWETEGTNVTATPFEEWRVSESEDWTGKTDLTKPHKWKKLKQKSRINFLWKEDKTWDGQKFINKYERGFGDGEVILDDKNLSGVKDIKIPFANTVMGDEFGGFPIPKILKDDDREPGKDNYREANYDSDPRLMLEISHVGAFTFEGTERSGVPTCYSCLRGSDPFTPNLCFQTERGYTNTGLQDRYYRQQIYIWNNAREFEGYLNITPTDIRTLKFNRAKLIQVENGTRVIYLEEISKFRHGTEGSTKVKAYG